MEQENLQEQTVETKTFDEMLQNKEYQSEFDKRVQKAIATAKSKWDKEQLDVKDSKDNEAIAKLEEEVRKLTQTITDKDEQEKKAKQEALLDNKVQEALKEKKFINEYTKSAIVDSIKASLRKNESANIEELLNELVKDKEGIFVNPNAPEEIPKTNDDVFTDVDKEAFKKMGYKERLILKQENPDLYEQLAKEK